MTKHPTAPRAAEPMARTTADVARGARATPMTRDAMQAALAAAAERLLAGKAKRTDGALDKATLCREAGVVRTSAYRACADVIAAFEQRVRDLAHDAALAHPLVRMQKRAEDAEAKVATLTDELQQANARITVLANQLNMALRRVQKAEDLRQSDHESLEAERVRLRKEAEKLRVAYGDLAAHRTGRKPVLALHTNSDKDA